MKVDRHGNVPNVRCCHAQWLYNLIRDRNDVTGETM